MTYELAVELKEAGFPFRFNHAKFILQKPFGVELDKDTEFYGYDEPILEELVEELGDELESIERDRGHIGYWLASSSGVFGRGKTMKVAVANLYIALNKK